MRYFKMFYRRITDDFKLKELLPVKILFFMQMSTILVLYPYLTIHMRELGIDVEETAIMSAVTPIVTIVMPPISGIVADRIGNFKVLLSGFSIVGGITALLLLYVPVGRIKVYYHSALVVGLSCSSRLPLELIIPNATECTTYRQAIVDNVSLSIVSCGYLCPTSFNAENITVDRYVTNYYSEQNEASKDYILSPEDLEFLKEELHPESHETLKINEQYFSAYRKFEDGVYYFPGKEVFDLSCYDANNTCEYSRNWKNGSKLNAYLQSKKYFFDDQTTYNVHYFNEGKKHSPICSDGFQILKNETISIDVFAVDNQTNVYATEMCEKMCIATTERNKLCTNSFKMVDINSSFTFWTYLAVRVFIAIIGGTAYTMFEGAVIAILREYKADYGLQKIYASLGGVISSPLSGWLIDYVSMGKKYTDFRPVFYLYAVLKVLSGIMMLFINLKFKAPAQKVVSEVRSILSVELFSVFVAVFLLGSAWGYIESFLFWLLQDLGSSKSLMGLTITTGGLLGIPILVVSGPLIKKLGHANVIFIGFIAYVIRLLGYSLIYNPWLALIFEGLECITQSLCFTAAVTYAARLSTQRTDTTIQGIFGGLFYGVGKSFGSLVGGYFIKMIGIRGTFQVFSGISGISGFLYLGFYHIYMKKRSILNEKKVVGEKENDNNQDQTPKKTDEENSQTENNVESMDFEVVTLPNDEVIITEVSMTNLAYIDSEDENNQEETPKRSDEKKNFNTITLPRDEVIISQDSVDNMSYEEQNNSNDNSQEEKSKKIDEKRFQTKDNDDSMNFEIVTLPNNEVIIAKVSATNFGYEDTEEQNDSKNPKNDDKKE
nr:uncharacterized protein LOC111414266 [Onthophagus taurus]XP_022901333.1 uncharacterized protein LOC111414266 [Onthophagus taurus]XP_022901334.1 uncharacterized protein LOC111414266 [Onthophagus taurus]